MDPRPELAGMPEVMLARAPVERGKVDRLREWYGELEVRIDEVVATLQHEDVYTESAFVDDSGDPAYLYVYMEAVDLEAADEAGDEEAYDVDAEHHEVLAECLAGDWEPLEPIGHYPNPERG